MKDSSGFTLVEVLVVVILMGILAAFAIPSVISARQPGRDLAQQIAGNFKLARAKAISKTSAVRIQAKRIKIPDPNNNNNSIAITQLVADTAPSCDNPNSDPAQRWIPDFAIDYDPPNLKDIQDAEIISPVTVNGSPVSAPTPANPVYVLGNREYYTEGDGDVVDDIAPWWQVCFNPRGILSDNSAYADTLTLIIKDNTNNQSRKVTLFKGGTVKVEEVN